MSRLQLQNQHTSPLPWPWDEWGSLGFFLVSFSKKRGVVPKSEGEGRVIKNERI